MPMLLMPRRASVKPRVTSRESAAALPLEDEMLRLLTSAHHVLSSAKKKVHEEDGL